MKRIAGKPEPPPARGSQRARTVDFNSPSSATNSQQGGSQNTIARKLIVPAFPTHATQTANFDGSRDALDDLRRSASSASTRSLPTRPGNAPSTFRNGPQVLRKPAPPPIPNKKPALLSKNSAQSTPQYRDDPRDRRSEEEMVKPPLPPRTGTGLSNGSGSGRAGPRGRNLMDDEPEDLGSLKGWEVLQPGR